MQSLAAGFAARFSCIAPVRLGTSLSSFLHRFRQRDIAALCVGQERFGGLCTGTAATCEEECCLQHSHGIEAKQVSLTYRKGTGCAERFARCVVGARGEPVGSGRGYDRLQPRPLLDFKPAGTEGHNWSLISRLRQDAEMLGDDGRRMINHFGVELLALFTEAFSSAGKRGELAPNVVPVDAALLLAVIADNAAPIALAEGGFEALERTYRSLTTIKSGR